MAKKSHIRTKDEKEKIMFKKIKNHIEENWENFIVMFFIFVLKDLKEVNK